MPEFPGYTGDANPAVQVVKVKAVTHRKDNPIMQTQNTEPCNGSRTF